MGSDAGGPKKGLLELDDPAADLDTGPESGPVPTIVPPYDPAALVEASEIRERAQTLTDEVALEQARLASMPSLLPPPRKPMPTAPGPLTVSVTDSDVEIDAGEAQLEALTDEDQAAVLADRLSPLSRVPVLARQLTELGSELQDPKTAYVLGFVDGVLPLETIVEVTGLPELDTLRVLDRMIAQGLVVFRGAGE